MHKLKKLFPQTLKNLYHLAKAVLANLVYGFPARKLKVIGVTGTDGKTTTCQLVASILEQAGKKVALASTINFRIDGMEAKNLSHFTTESAFAVQKFLAEALKAECEYVVLETSSHALDQHRVWGIDFEIALVTNITREHLDYHKTLEKYRQAKLKLFTKAKKVIVNLDMTEAEEFLQFGNQQKMTYSVKNKEADVWAENIKLGIAGSTFEVQKEAYEIRLPGLFNVENALAASAVGLIEGIKPETIKEALLKIKGVAGRLEAVENDRGLNILVDFALTPNALEKLYGFLATVKEENTRIIAVFGSCGERDQGKRPLMGEIVSNYADYVVLTNDEPYHEDPAQIIEAIAGGLKNKKENETFWKIPDRREAIHQALQLAKSGDIIAVTGMGNFETMVVGSKKIPWNDKQVILEELEKIEKI